VYKLSPNGDGSYSETVLYSFAAGTDGNSPTSGVVMDKNGNLFGATAFGGSNTCSCGTVFELSPRSNGTWQEKVIYRFAAQTGTNAANPLVLDSSGNIFGSEWGNATSYGFVFELSPNGKGGWREQTIHTFGTGSDARYISPIIMDAKGNLYGMGNEGGTYNEGVIFELTPSGSTWTDTILYNFNCHSQYNPCYPSATLTLDGEGNIYGESNDTVFKFSTATQRMKTLASLTSNTLGYPEGFGVALDNAGNLYGSTYDSGLYEEGTLFELSPTSSGLWQATDLLDFNPGVSVIGNARTLQLTPQGALIGTSYDCLTLNGCVYQLTP
jgi:hypothetical protein